VRAVPVAEHGSELVDQGPRRGEFPAAGGDRGGLGAILSASLPGGVRIQLATFMAAGAGGGVGVALSRRSWAVWRRSVCRLPVSAGLHRRGLPVGAENLRQQTILMNHAPGAVTPLNPEMVQAGDAARQRA
jgi:hypothetical protein